MVFQNYALYPHMSVYDNMGFGLRMRKFDRAEIKKRVQDAAEILGIQNLLARKPRQLSGGQRQRVALGRAIVRHPQVFLFDEPLSNLDAKLRVQMRVELKKIHNRLSTTAVYVTHDQVEAMTLASRVGVIRDGRLLQVGTPREIYENPADCYVASRLGTPQINFLPHSLAPDVPAPPGTETIGIRTEHLQIATRNGGALVGRVHRIEHLGEQNHVHLECRGQTMITLADPHQPLQAGEEVELRLRHPLYFDAAGQRIPAIA
jgi:multiple sugar transport system ATP-binding protein